MKNNIDRNMERKTRVRFAPSPTGPLHMGGVRTALYNYLFAKQRGGDFIIRIEDTDSQRFVPGAEKYIIEALNWCGIVPDEGVDGAGTTGTMEEEILDRISIQDALIRLSERERTVIHLRYFRGLTQDKTAKIMGVSQVQVSRIEKKALGSMRKYLYESM